MIVTNPVVGECIPLSQKFILFNFDTDSLHSHFHLTPPCLRYQETPLPLSILRLRSGQAWKEPVPIFREG